jgi:8-oxo-dGTP pyrophosphatase MutT (NUDIX family)
MQNAVGIRTKVMHCYTATMAKICDNKSVGVIIERDGKIALLKRAKFPIAIAPPAGHIDDHGSPEQAAIDEVNEELGLVIASVDLKPTAIANRRVENRCRREGGDHHFWWVFQADKTLGELKPSEDETQGAGWYTREELQELASRAKSLLAADAPQEDWQQNPGLEPVWLDFLSELGYVKK